MIVEAAIAAGTVVVVSATWGALWLANQAHRREDAALTPRRSVASIAEERRILERDRAEWVKCYASADRAVAVAAVQNTKEIDRKLIELAREEKEPL